MAVETQTSLSSSTPPLTLSLSSSSSSSVSNSPSSTSSPAQGQSSSRKPWIIVVATISALVFLAFTGLIAYIFVLRKRQAKPLAPTELQVVPGDKVAAWNQDSKVELPADDRPMTGYSVELPTGHTRQFGPPELLELPGALYKGDHAKYHELPG
jgi:hypothetical protein